MSWQGQVNQPIGIAGIDSNGKIHALDASQIFNLNASNISSGSIAIARLPNGGVNGVSQLIQLNASGNLPALDASALTNLSAANIVGTIPISNFSKATTTSFGVVQIGSNINVSAGVISVPAATTSVLGVGQPDGVTTTISNGLLIVSPVSIVPNIVGGSAGSILHQTSANTTGFLTAANGAVVGNSGAPIYTATPTITGTNFSSVPNSATTAVSTATASTIVARDSNGDFSTHNFTVTGNFIGNMVEYNAYDPTLITGSSTLNTEVSMIIATGSADYTVTLPDAASFPASQLGKAIYYVNNSSGSNTVASASGGYVNTPFSITGATTTPPLYALNSTNLPTVTNVTIAGNLATATADNASVQTFDYVAANNILEVTPKVTFTNGNVLEVDPSSTVGSVKLSYPENNRITLGMSLVFDIYDTPGEYNVEAGTQVSTQVWSLQTLPQSEYVNHIRFGGGKFVMGAGSNGGSSQGPLSSADGKTWIAGNAVFGTGLYDFAYGNSKWIGINGGSRFATSSTDGITWTLISGTTYSGGLVMSYGAGVFVYLIILGSVGEYSIDGTSWTPITLPASANWSDIIFANGLFVAISNINSNVAVTSPDGITWTQRTLPASINWSSITYGNGLYVAVASNSTTAATSSDGITWSSITLPTGAYGITYGNGTFITVNESREVMISTDGVSWSINSTQLPNLASNNWRNIMFGNNVYVASNATTGTGSNVCALLNTVYTFTMTSPVLPAVPTWAAVGGQSMQYSVSATSTPSFTNAATPVITRVGNEMTITYAAATPTAAPHLQLKALGLNSGDILKQIGADLHVLSNSIVTIPTGGKYALTPTLTEGWQTLKFAG